MNSQATWKNRRGVHSNVICSWLLFFVATSRTPIILKKNGVLLVATNILQTDVRLPQGPSMYSKDIKDNADDGSDVHRISSKDLEANKKQNVAPYYVCTNAPPLRQFPHGFGKHLGDALGTHAYAFLYIENILSCDISDMVVCYTYIRLRVTPSCNSFYLSHPEMMSYCSGIPSFHIYVFTDTRT